MSRLSAPVIGKDPYIRDVLFNQLKITNKKILVIGAGGFTLTARGANNNEVTYLDIDPAIKKFAEDNFLKKKIIGHFIGQDARSYLNQSATYYDVIISDAYSHQVSIPPQLLTTDYFQQLARHLSPSGLLVVNLISDPLFKDDFSKRVDNTIRQVFNFCAIVPLKWANPLENVIYICSNQDKEQRVYTDNLTTATFDFFSTRKNIVL